MRWAGHVIRMKDERLSKRAITWKHGDGRKWGRHQLRWEDCLGTSKKDGGGRKLEGKAGIKVIEANNSVQFVCNFA